MSISGQQKFAVSLYEIQDTPLPEIQTNKDVKGMPVLILDIQLPVVSTNQGLTTMNALLSYNNQVVSPQPPTPANTYKRTGLRISTIRNICT